VFWDDKPNCKGDPADVDERVLLFRLVIQCKLFTPRQEEHPRRNNVVLAARSTKGYVMSSLTVAVEKVSSLRQWL